MGNEKTKLTLRQIVIISFIIGILIGFGIGAGIQQILIIKAIEGAGESWEGIISEMNIEVDINETKLVQETAKLFPELNITDKGNKTQ